MNRWYRFLWIVYRWTMYNLIIFQHWIQISISLYKFRQIQRNQTIQINNSIISRFQNKNLQHLDFNPSSTLIIAHYHGVSKPLFLLILHQEYSPKPPNLTSIKSSLPTDAFKLLLFEKEREREREKHTTYIGLNVGVLALISDTRYRATSVQRVKKRRVDHLGDDARCLSPHPSPSPSP